MKTSGALFIRIGLGVGSVVMTSALAGCGVEPLTPLATELGSSTSTAAVDANLCTSAPNPAKQNLKYLFILDHSASNQPGVATSTGDVTNTDSGGARRYGPLYNFVKNLIPTPSTVTSFALIDFNDTATQIGSVTGFDSDATHFASTIATDWTGSGTAASPAPHDSGFTNYQSALQLAQALITNDAKSQAIDPSNIIQTSYVIIFVSDGIPVVQSSSSSSGTYTQTYTDDIGPVLSSILDLKNDVTVGPLISGITVNTAYYYGADGALQPAETLLQTMATNGNGQYVTFASGKNILYQQFAPPVRNIVNSLVDVFVENKNLVWWDDGRHLADSDGDGLPDAIERQVGSDPYKADSDGNGVNDLVEYRFSGHACADASCSATGRNAYSSCSGFTRTIGSDGTIVYASSTNDGLNDCEKHLLGASRSSFNTNGDMIPDELAFRSGLSIVAGSDGAAFTDVFNDGINNYNKIKQALPIQVSLASLLDYTPQITTITRADVPAGSAAGISCYHVHVDNVPLMFGSNTIVMHLIQNQTALTNKPFLLNATTVIGDGQTNVSFTASDFK